MKEELEMRLYMDCCNVNAWNGMAWRGLVWIGLEISKLRVIMRSAVKGGRPLRKEKESGYIRYIVEMSSGAKRSNNFF
jgi:hypothetical protein